MKGGRGYNTKSVPVRFEADLNQIQAFSLFEFDWDLTNLITEEIIKILRKSHLSPLSVLILTHCIFSRVVRCKDM